VKRKESSYPCLDQQHGGQDRWHSLYGQNYPSFWRWVSTDWLMVYLNTLYHLKTLQRNEMGINEWSVKKRTWKNEANFTVVLYQYTHQVGELAEICKCSLPEENYLKLKTKLRGLSPRANYTDRAAAAGRRS
jgi:hypothetical protein